MEMLKSLDMTLVFCPGLTCILEGWQNHSLVDFQLKCQKVSNYQELVQSYPKSCHPNQNGEITKITNEHYTKEHKSAE